MVRFEVAVVGGGPAGCAAAAAASAEGATVVLLDPLADPALDQAPRVGESAAPGTPRLVAEIFGTEGDAAFTADRHLVCPGTVSAWGTARTTVTDHLSNPLGDAWNLDRRTFDDDLRRAVVRLGVELRPAKLASLERGPGGWVLETPTDRPERLRADMVIDASGRGARVARQLGARQTHGDHLVALWSLWLVDQADQRASTYVESVEGGWWYSTLLPGGRRVVAHLTDPDLLPTSGLARRDLVLSARELPLIGELLGASGEPTLAGEPRVTVARSSQLDHVVGPGWLATGDAAFTVDPLSGRGIVSALLTGRAAGEAAAAIVAGNAPRGAPAYTHLMGELHRDGLTRQTEAYEDERRWPQAPFWRRRLRSTDAGTLARTLLEQAR
jgi:flavin-dependent dehydrogenase